MKANGRWKSILLQEGVYGPIYLEYCAAMVEWEQLVPERMLEWEEELMANIV